MTAFAAMKTFFHHQGCRSGFMPVNAAELDLFVFQSRVYLAFVKSANSYLNCSHVYNAQNP